jgi:hypothetical protein
MSEMYTTDQLNEHNEAASPPANQERYRRAVVTSLTRGELSAQRGLVAVRRLVRTVAEWRPLTGVAVTLASQGGRVQCELTLIGASQPGWIRDVRFALSPVATVAQRASASRLPIPIGEIIELRRRSRPASLRDMIADLDDPARGQGKDRAVVEWPVCEFGAVPDLVALLAAHPGVLIRTVLAPATEVEQDMLGDDLAAGWDRIRTHELPSYRGSIVRLRTFVAAVSGEVPAAVRAAVRAWGSGLELEVIPDQRSLPAWHSTPSRLAGAVVPEGLALSLLRLPVAGTMASLGMPSRRPPLPARPLDPLPPRPSAPVRLGSAFSATGRKVDASLELTDLLRHAFIEGRTGAGKSTLLTSIGQSLAALDCGFTYLDPHGTGIDALLQVLPAEAMDRTTVVRHGDLEAPVRINILSETDPDRLDQVVEEFIELIQKMVDPQHTGMVGPRWKRWFNLIARAVVLHFGSSASLLHITAVASDLDRVRSLVARIRPVDPELSGLLMAEVGSLRGEEAATMSAWAMSKFHPLIASRAMRQIVGTGVDSVDVDAVVADRGGLLVDLAAPILGASAARVLAAIWMLKHWMAMGRRADPERPYIIMADEAHLLTFGALPAMLAEGRKFGFGLVLASQSIDGLPDTLQSGVEANVGTFVSLRLGLRTALSASARLGGWPVDELIHLPDLVAATSLSRGGVSTDAFRLTVDHHRRMSKAGLPDERSRARASAMTAISRSRLAVPHMHLAPPSDAELVAALARAPHTGSRGGWSPDRSSADASSAPTARPGVGTPPTLGDTLDDWMSGL